MDYSAKTYTSLGKHKTDCLAVATYTDGSTDSGSEGLGALAEAQIKAVCALGDFEGKTGQSHIINGVEGLAAARLLLVGAGSRADTFSSADAIKFVNTMVGAVKATKSKSLSLIPVAKTVADKDDGWITQQVSQLFEHGLYQYDATKSEKAKAPALKKLTLLVEDRKQVNAANKALAKGEAIGIGANRARQLGNLPGNVCTPTYLVSEARNMARKYKSISTKALTEKQMRELGMGSLLSVGNGSEQESKLIIIEYKGGRKTDKPYVLVGKGITFDSGGISLKPGAAMDEMKFDMCGAASVFGTMETLAVAQPKINVTAIVAAAENMPSGRATKPGDIVTSLSGKTIEILNTDAEGRLVLCDALTYAERYKPQAVIDVATLTGACVIALGKIATGLYANDQSLADELLAAGVKAHDRAWQMPLWDDYKPLLNSNFADIANLGTPHGASITAAVFLSRFTEKFPWAHLDIAGTAWHSGPQKGATGRPVPMLSEFLMDKAG